MLKNLFLLVALAVMVVVVVAEKSGVAQEEHVSQNHVRIAREAYGDLEDGLDGLASPWLNENTEEKRAYGGLKRVQPSRRLVTFQCSRKSAVCRNGGKGPRVTFLKGGVAMCACMCPFGYHEAQCQESWWNSKENSVA